MPPKTRRLALIRKPVWNSVDWLEEHYDNNNGLPGFFSHGEYSFELREDAEKDYIFTIEQALKSDNENFCNWAINIKENKYSPLNLATTKKYWKGLVNEEIQELKRKRLHTTLLSQATSSQTPIPKRPKKLYIAKDLMYLDDLRESVGTIIGSAARTTAIVDRKTNYFKTLAMNQIVDLSDTSQGSHLDLFSTLQQQQIIQKLSLPKILTHSNYDTTIFDDVIEKFAGIEDEKIFLNKTIKGIDDIKTGDKQIQKIYLQILETMLYDGYLFDPNEQNSENDYLVKLHGPIMESSFRGTGIRLRWGDTKPKECKDNGFNCKIDMRVTTNFAKCIDLSAAEYANKPGTSKYYKDKLKLVLSGLVHLKKYVSSNKTTAELNSVPLMLVEGLEGESFILFFVDNDWLALQKTDDIDVPFNVELIKNGDIKLYINGLKLFKDVRSKTHATRQMKNITQTKQKPNGVLKKPIWNSEFVDETSDDD